MSGQQKGWWLNASLPKPPIRDVVRMGTIEEYVDLNGSRTCHMVIYFRLYSSFTTRVTNGVFADAVSDDDDTAWATV